MTQELLAAEQLYGGYQGFDVLHGASMAVLPGESVAIIGPNGAGKSTFLKAVFGMVHIRQGKIIFAGEEIQNLAPQERLKRGVAICPQGRCNFPAMSVRENLEMGGVLLPKQQMEAEIERLIQIFPILGKRLKQQVGTMSGGEQQQLEMAMALMGDPKLLLIDEPSLGLDPKNVELIFEIMAGLKAENISILIVEQNAVKALQATDRAYVLEQGQTRLSGTSEEILHNPDVRELYLGGGVRREMMG